MGYQQTQMRLLFLFDYAPEDRWTQFKKVAEQRGLAASTTAAYWIAFQTLRKIMGEAERPEDGKISRFLEARAAASPASHPLPMTTAHARRLMQRMDEPIVTAILLAFVMGQRISDVMQLAGEDLTTNGKNLVITFRRGKVIPKIGPFTLALALDTAVARQMVEMAKGRPGFLFTPANSEAERLEMQSRVRQTLVDLDARLEARSIRRGGLQAMATRGESMESMLRVSKHASEKMLMRYLDWGACAQSHIISVSSLASETHRQMAQEVSADLGVSARRRTTQPSRSTSRK